MLRVELKESPHSFKLGDTVAQRPPNAFEDTLFTSGGAPVGFYLKNIPERLAKLVNVANAELNSERVPKHEMRRVSGWRPQAEVRQFSCIIGNVPPMVHMRRPYASKSSVHAVPTAKLFIKAMVAAGREALSVMNAVAPELYQAHKEAVEREVPEPWRFCDLFTSSNSNFNIAAQIHQDNLNVKGTCNVIITKRSNSVGGCLFVPDYDLTFACADNSMIVYPAWRNKHGVTPIEPTHPGGYRNSLVWYALTKFKDA